MTPDTVHLLAQFIRHERGLATALETWLRRQPASATCDELREVIGAFRGVLASYESQLSHVVVDYPLGTEAAQPTHTAVRRLSSPQLVRR